MVDHHHMTTTKRRPFIPFLAGFASLFTLLTPVRAQECTSSNPSSCTVQELYEVFWQEAMASKAADVTARAVVGANIPATSPSSFASRVHSSYQEFLNLFDFAINSLEESDDGKELLVRLNPIRSGSHRLGLSLTLNEPSLFEPLVENIPAAVRQETVEQLEDEQSDLSDQTWSLAYSKESKSCNLASGDWCWGRSPAIYRDALSRGFEAVAKGSPEELPENMKHKAEIVRLIAPDPNVPTDISAIPLSQLPSDKRDQVIERIQQWATSHAELTVEEQTYYRQFDFERLASLLDNQPQLSGTVSFHNRDDLGGPSESEVALELQMGTENLNSLARRCPGKLDSCIVDVLRKESQPPRTSKLVLGLSYRRVEDYEVDAVDANGPVAGFVPIDLGRSSQASIRLQWGFRLPSKVIGREPRFDLAVEGWRSYSDEVRNDNRLTATATLAVPLGYDLTLPFSVSYANKPEFLEGEEKSLGVHFGLTYRLPWERDTGPR
jgi:hypothetical protein